MSKRRKALELLIVLTFLMIIAVPLLFSDKTGGQVSESENRFLASAPTLFVGRKLNWQGGELRTQVENWINDNAYGRTRFKNMLSDFETATLQMPRYDDLLYADDWVFLWRYDLPDRMLHTNLPSQSTLDSLLTKAQQIGQEMERRGAAFSMTLHPHKADLCYGHLPATLHVAQETSLMDLYMQTFTGREDLIVSSSYDTMKQLRDAAPDPNVNSAYYAAYDASHWNRNGAFYGYLSQMEAIAASYPGVTYFDRDDYRIEPVSVTRTWYGRTYTEADTAFTLLPQRQAARNDSFFTDIGVTGLSDPWGVNRYYCVPDSDKPKALIIGDSYTWMYFIDDMAESFSQMLYINVEDAASLWTLMDIYQPEVVSYAGINVANFLTGVPNP